MKVRNTSEGEKIELQMTPMIDIVFQLLVFFIMTFKVVVQEGDFNIKMPLAAPSEGLPDDNLVPPLKVTLTANASGRIQNIRLADESFGTSYNQLQGKIIDLVGANSDSGPSTMQDQFEVEFEVDYDLRYEETVKAVTAVSGFHDKKSKEIIKLIEKIKFKPPTKPS